VSLFVLRRLLQALITLLALSVVLFIAIFAIGDPIAILIDPDASPEERLASTRALGLDQSLLLQYFAFVGQISTGSFGRSFFYNRPVADLIALRLPATLELAVVAMVFTVLLALPIGLWAGLRPHARSSRLMMAGSVAAFSLPSFWFGLLLILTFSVGLGWLPSGGRGPTLNELGHPMSIATAEGWRYLLLPALTMALYNTALVSRIVRAGVRETMQHDYIRYAYAKGLSERRIVGVHVMKNMLVPVVTVLGIEFGHLIALTVVVETVFSWPGMGQLLIQSIYNLDRPAVVGVLMTTVSMVILINLLVDILYGVLDPRVRLGVGA
jgi:peptide/nickel transport system permease protein